MNYNIKMLFTLPQHVSRVCYKYFGTTSNTNPLVGLHIEQGKGDTPIMEIKLLPENNLHIRKTWKSYMWKVYYMTTKLFFFYMVYVGS